MDDPANSTTTPPEPFWHAENKTEPVTVPTPPPPVSPPSLTADEPIISTTSSSEPSVVIKSKKSGSGTKVILGVLIFLLISAAGVLGYMAIQGKGLPFNLGKKAAGCEGAYKICGLNGACGASNDCACFLDYNTCTFADWSCCSTQPPSQPPSPPVPTSPGQPSECTVSWVPEGSAGLCIKADGAEVKAKICLNAANCTGGTRSFTYRRTVANCSGTSCAGTCGNEGEMRTLTVLPGQLCAEETVGCSVTNKCGNCQVDANGYGERAWQDSGCTVIPTNTPVPTSTPRPTATPIPTTPSCSGLILSQSTITLGQSVTVSANISNYGLIRYGVCTGGTDCRLVDSQNPTTLGSGNSPVSKSFTPTAVGKYVFEVNAYDSSTCNSFCSAGSIWYKNALVGGGGCDTSGHWTSSGSCTSTGCIKWLTVIEAPASPVCLDVTVVKKGTSSLEGLVPGDTIVITVTASGTVSDMATRIKKDGVTLAEVFSAEGTWVEQGKKWKYEYVIPASGQFEVSGFIKASGGVWK
ncbi:hypothetical protein COS54_02560 [Candidatus Shapirobacteria bacterium CG03_land_8_20_14_0_80_39_12]|uniref:Uncharacterized protein n=1 Tax=Candidatus Shapirobacteria bacterium CG03_land_8_20_14_0_80_39_12 TaxID=1974879 RepID=A0A2M7BBZ0_9BACT|nr:MAG: hypothetical protein COS54_02560 [Candidatus Shapirobacteria bacterium CG03_land_8_20_14_0_80_39_12]